MPDTLPIAGRVLPTRRDVDRQTLGRSADWRWWRSKLQDPEDVPGILICPRCHAISDHKRWFYDERRYQELKWDKTVRVVCCPGCTEFDRSLHGGEVRLRSPLLRENKRQVLQLIRDVERRAMLENPLARLAAIHDHGEEVVVLTTTPFLARRIGTEFKEAFDGQLQVDKLPHEDFVRVYWERPLAPAAPRVLRAPFPATRSRAARHARRSPVHPARAGGRR
ncbi:MAG: hypothetical protein KatS3mg059_0781 [Thermomicrobiales bacterium]|nr:MAG: hypothetical protein KatS3mg059_0781 [Thermomicrobiales bacterium]